ncbi:MAG: hypothetical protein LBI31_00290, partial [Zoogloeaceae bacterium]|nr:hypothetical protein [Zoogloeaceae bacterium]
VARLKKQLEDSEKRIEAEQERLDKEQHVVVDTEEKVATGDAVPEAGMEEMPVEVTPAEDLPPVALPQQKDVTPPAQSPGALDEAVGAEEGGMDMLTWGGGAVLLALVGSLAFLARRRKARKDDLGWPVSMPRTMPQPPRKAREELEESDWHSPSSAESALGQSGLSEKGLDSVSQPATTGQSVDAGNEATQPFGQDQALPDSHPDTYEGDPVEEADVYISYGRDAQAEELLLDALPKNPNRIEIRLKLLEIYANRKSLRDFEVIAKEIQAQTGGKGPDWDKVVTMGAALDPDNPLYGGSGLGGASSASKSAEEEALLAHMRTDSDIPSVPDDDSLLQMLGKDSEAQKPMDSDQDFGLEAAEQTEKRSPPPEPVPPKPAETESEPEFAFDEEPVSAPEPESPSVPEQFVEDEVATTAMDQGAMETQANPEPAFAKTLTRAEETEGMNLPGLDMESEAMMEDMEAEGSTLTSRDDAQGEDAAFEMRPTESAPSDSAGSLDGLSNIDLDLREPPSAEETPEAELPFAEEAQEELSAPAGELPEELEAMGDMESPDAKREEVNTKLDLAKVYEEMGDLEGARELLKEVVNEGTPSQVEQAKATLARLNP